MRIRSSSCHINWLFSKFKKSDQDVLMSSELKFNALYFETPDYLKFT